MIDAWSFSRYEVWAECPLKFKYKVIEKAPFTQSPAMARGDRIHKEVAAYIMTPMDAAVTPPADAMKHQAHARLINELRAMPAENKLVEQQWGFDPDWKPVGWFGPQTWLRVVADVSVLYPDLFAEVVDWKTGKHYEKSHDQMELTATATMCRFPPAVHVSTRLAYLDDGKEFFNEFPAKDKAKLIDKWNRKVAPMFNDTMYAPRPGPHCGRCDFSRSKGGKCRFG